MQIKSASVPVLACCLLALSTAVVAQEKKTFKFGKITPEDFKETRYAADTGAHAVVLADIGSSGFDAEDDDFQLVYKRHRRVKILDKNGYDAANVEIPLYKDGRSEETVSNLKAVTYNLEDGAIVETRLESKDVFTDGQDKHVQIKKFTLPAVKEGSIIEFSYTVSSPFYFNLQPWSFQGEYPCLYSEYAVSIPEVFDFIFLGQGYHKFESKTRDDAYKSFNFRFEEEGAYGTKTGRTEHYSFHANVSTYRWVARDVPPLKEESYTTSIANHITRIEFQLSAVKWPNSPVKPVMGTWAKLSEDMLKNEYYGAALDKNNGFFSDEVTALTAGASSDEAKARNIYAYVRNNFTCTDHSARYVDKPLKTVFTSKNGNVTEINLLLVAMLRKAGLKAYPVLLSTRNHGVTYPMYPLLSRFNYTVAALYTPAGVRYLDASYPLGFGRLHASCYNGHARMLNEECTAVSFEADSLLEQKYTTVFLKPENGVLKGAFQQRPTYFESYNLRNLVREKGKDAYFKPLAGAFSAETTISNTAIEELDSLESAALVKYDFEMRHSDEDVLYINPMFGEARTKNPFSSQQRMYPVEMPYVIDEIYAMNLEIPEGYQVEELPKSALAKFNETEGMFQYMIAQNGNMIQFRSRIKLSRATFMPDEYNSLREFFDLIVKKQAEQIVLKKKA